MEDAKLDWSERQAIHASPWFAALPAALRHDILRLAWVVRHADGEPVLRCSDAAMPWLGCARGALRLCSAPLQGKRSTLDIVPAGAWFGESAVLEGGPPPHDMFAIGRTTVLRLAPGDFRQLLAEHPALYPALLKLGAQRTHRLLEQVQDLKTLDLGQRLAKQLWQLAQSQGAATGSDVAITLRLAQHELAQMLGASRQRINEQLKRLERLSVLNVATGRLELHDLGALQRWAQQGVPG